MSTTPPPTGPRPASAHGGPDPHDAAATIAGGPSGSEGSGSPAPARTAIIAAVALASIAVLGREIANRRITKANSCLPTSPDSQPPAARTQPADAHPRHLEMITIPI
jgi:hypothetical protein